MIGKIILTIIAVACVGIKTSSGQQDSSKRDIFNAMHKLFIYKGTKWCGPSNIAKSDDDLGENRETDKCCREHDKNCKARIKGFRKNYYLWNLSWKTASHCDCEKRFKDCLNSVGSQASEGLYKIYFEDIEPRCIRFRKEKVCVRRSWGICVEKKEVNKAYFVPLKEVIG